MILRDKAGIVALALIFTMPISWASDKREDMRWNNIDIAEIPTKTEQAIKAANANPSATSAFEASQLIWIWLSSYEMAKRGEISETVEVPRVDEQQMLALAEQSAMLGSDMAAPFLADYLSTHTGSKMNKKVTECWDRAAVIDPLERDKFVRQAKICVQLRLRN
jgi:hypothetical protein